jgi:hypothetical protein
MKLIAIGIGTAERAQEFSEHVNFPLENLYADPDNAVYDRLNLVKNISNTFFNPATPYAILDRIQNGRTQDLQKALSQWKPWIPPKFDQGLQQGGAFVFDGDTLLYGRKDKATGDHVNINTLLDVILE